MNIIAERFSIQAVLLCLIESLAKDRQGKFVTIRKATDISLQRPGNAIGIFLDGSNDFSAEFRI